MQPSVVASSVFRYLGATLLVLLLAPSVSASTVTDLAGRKVELPDTIERIVLGESRYIPALAILEGEHVVDRLVGMLPDFEMTDPAGYAQYLARFPALADVPRVGHTSADSFSLEHVLAMDPDLAIFSLDGHGPGARHQDLIDRLERAGVVVIFIDFRQRPLENTQTSMAVLGEVLGREAQAQAFNRFYQSELDKVRQTVNRIPESHRLKVFLHSRLGRMDGCCETMARGMMSDFISFAGGHNMATELLPGVSGMLSLETLLTEPPDRYLATAIGAPGLELSADDLPYVVLGAGVDENTAQRTFQRAVSRPGLEQLDPINVPGHALAIWHHFYNTPLNVVAVQAIAKWLYPLEFSALSPQSTLAELYQRFQPVPLSGRYWVTLGDEAP